MEERSMANEPLYPHHAAALGWPAEQRSTRGRFHQLLESWATKADEEWSARRLTIDWAATFRKALVELIAGNATTTEHKCCGDGTEDYIECPHCEEPFEPKGWIRQPEKVIETALPQYKQIGIKHRAPDGRTEYLWWETPPEGAPVYVAMGSPDSAGAPRE
jgi:hypothetical protein